jgi:hypothetical protein
MRGQGKKILSISEREGLVDEKKELEGQLKQSEFGKGTAAEQMDLGAVRSQIAKLDKAIHDGEAPSVRGANKDRLYARAKELEEIIKKGMPTQYEMDNPGRAIGAVGKHRAWERITHAAREEYRQIMRTLEPDDPTGVDVEKFRREK